MAPHVRTQMGDNVSQEHDMASPILMPRGQRPESDKANPVAVLRVGPAMTEQLMDDAVDFAVPAAAEPLEGGGEHVVPGGGIVEFRPPLLDLADDHVRHAPGDPEQPVGFALGRVMHGLARARCLAEPKCQDIQVGQALLAAAAGSTDDGELRHGEVPVEPQECLHQRDRVVHHARSFRLARTTLTSSSIASGMQDTAMSGMHSSHPIVEVFMSEDSV